MSKPLSKYDEREVVAAVNRRIEQGSKQGAVKGLGYWAARDYMERQRKAKQPEK